MSSRRLNPLLIPTELQGNITNKYYEYIQLSQEIEKGDVEAVTDLLNQRPDTVDAWMNVCQTPLLKACACGQTEIAKELLRRMTPEQMFPKTDKSYHTPLSIVATNGNIEIAKALIAKNPKVLEILDLNDQLPVVVAVENAQVEMARYLYTRTPIQLLFDEDAIHAAELITSAIVYKMFDIVLDLFNLCRRLAVIGCPHTNLNPLTVLALKPDLFKGGCKDLGPLKRFIYYYTTLMGKLGECLLKWTGIDEVYQLKVMHLQVKKLLVGISEETMALDSHTRSKTVDKALQYAVRSGNMEFVVEIVKHNSELLWSTEYSSTSRLFFLAIQYRQKEVLNFFYCPKLKHLLLNGEHRRQVLNWVTSLAPRERLATIAGAASQMQSELKWFMEIEDIAPDKSNLLADTPPFELFSENHYELLKDAEKSMKDMAGSCSLVAALIVTVTFAAVFTVPGGTDEKARGTPFHIKERPFMIFVVSDVISCFAACTSLLIFLGILTSRYDFEDFLVSLPTKMITGLTLMFISIAAMLMAFWSALFTVLNQNSWLIAPVVVVACFPAILFVRLQYPLLKEMIISTYGKGILDSNVPPTNHRSIGFQVRNFIHKVMSSSIKYICCRF